jgi:hypothetical protein
MNEWLDKSREETDTRRMPDKYLDEIIVSNPALGINVYRNAIPKDSCKKTISTLEKVLNSTGPYSWQPANVTESDDPLLEARYCVDFKIGQKNLGEVNQYNKKLYELHEDIFQYVYKCSVDYGRYWGVGLNYFEVFNFVRYESPGQHFNIHADHGPAYVTTISAVAYLNDDYEGGELYFPRFNLTIKPEAGDIVFFPSTFIYEHSSEPMISGTKYSVVIMTDYNSRGGLRYYPYRQNEETLIY